MREGHVVGGAPKGPRARGARLRPAAGGGGCAPADGRRGEPLALGLCGILGGHGGLGGGSSSTMAGRCSGSGSTKMIALTV